MKQKIDHPAIRLAHKRGLVRARELAEAGAAGAILQQMIRHGDLIRIRRGLYAPPGRVATELDQLAQVATKYPNVVFCLLTALRTHGLTTQSPHEVWVALSSSARAPVLDYPPLRIVRFSSPTLGVEKKAIQGGGTITVTSVAKTVVDCFKFRNKIGLDIAIEALRDAWQTKKVTMDELWDVARQLRVANVMRPYLESLAIQ